MKIIVLLILSFYCISCNKDLIFEGQKDFEVMTPRVFELSEATLILRNYLRDTNETFVTHPHLIIIRHGDGYLFVVGLHEMHIRIEGYYVSIDGKVSWLNLNRTISLREYEQITGNKKHSIIEIKPSNNK